VNFSSGAVASGGRPSSRATASPSNGFTWVNVQATWATVPCSHDDRASLASVYGSATSSVAIGDATHAVPPTSAEAST